MGDIILTGPKHCGKSTAGKALASLISGSFIDLDEKITEITGSTPRELYKAGPAVFQKAEAEALSALIMTGGKKKRVIATGGGIIDNPEAAALLAALKNSGAKIVYLDIPAAAAWERISSKELPPFLQTDNPQETHRVLHNRRAAEYRKIADIVINTEGKSPQNIAETIKYY